MKRNALADWLFERDIDISNFYEGAHRIERRSQTREAERALSATFSAAGDAGEAPLTIPTHYVRKPKFVTVALFAIILAIIFLVFAADTWARYVYLSRGLYRVHGQFWFWIILVQIVGLFLLYKWLFKPLMRTTYYAMKRRLAVSAGEAVMHDQRPPTILLRSFKSEHLKVRSGFAERQRLEEVLAPLCSKVGPFIAIGKPQERNPSLGAARDYISDDKWQETVAKWFDAAAVILVIADETPGLKWELDKLRESGNAGKVILINPRLPEEKKIDLLGNVRQLWSDPAGLGNRDSTDLGPNVIMHLTSDGSLRTISDRENRNARKYRTALVAALTSMFLRKEQPGRAAA